MKITSDASNIAILGDLHFGKHSDSIHLLNYQEKFFNDIFFPELEQRNITTIIQLGDLFDKRKHINFYTLKRCKEFFFDRCEEANIKLYSLLGNHDTFYKSTNELNSPSQLLTGYRNIHIVNQPTTIQFDHHFHLDLVPWINDDNFKECLEWMEASSSQYCAGHFEVLGAELMTRVKAQHGLSPDMFSSYQEVYSGHFHKQSYIKNIHYIGIPYQLTFADIEDDKGFYVISIKDRVKQFITNPYCIYLKKYISSVEDIKNLDVNDKYVRLIITKDVSREELKTISLMLSDNDAIDISLQETVDDIVVDDTISDTGDIQSPLDVLLDYINQHVQQDANVLIPLVNTIYHETLNEYEEMM